MQDIPWPSCRDIFHMPELYEYEGVQAQFDRHLSKGLTIQTSSTEEEEGQSGLQLEDPRERLESPKEVERISRDERWTRMVSKTKAGPCIAAKQVVESTR